MGDEGDAEQDADKVGGASNEGENTSVECSVNQKVMSADEANRLKCDINSVLIMNESNKKAVRIEDEVEIDKKDERESDEEECIPPALPPRPPPRTRQIPSCSCTCDFGIGDDDFRQSFQRTPSRSCWTSGLRKYVFLCTTCGSLSILLGTLFLTVYFMLKSYTSSLNHFETIPTYVPSGMLIATGFLIICLACRKNRNSFLMKLCGLCTLCCAVLCVSVTVTTTVIHMNRLQTLRECLYTQKTQSCTCYSVLMDNERTSDEGVKFVFNSTPDCEVVHGALYSCLRAIFGLSVIGILVCIFSCMLVYQLLSHEKKKMYWAQLEMRCRYLYRQQRNPHYCSCCDDCRYPPPPHEIFPWELMGNRFWSSGRIGNLYTPNPEDRDGNSRLRSAWNWRRLPWNRSGSNTNEPSRANLGSPDSQYGFSSTPTVDGAPYTVLDPRTANCPPGVPPTADITEGGFYSWGPPPPYASNRNSANNSPARRSLGEILHQVSPIRRNDNVSPIRPYHHVHHHHVHHPHPVNHQCTSSALQIPAPNTSTHQKPAPSRAVQQPADNLQQRSGASNLRSNSLTSVNRFQKLENNKDNYENTYESENFPSGFNTLPSLKKRNQTRASEIFPNETTSSYYFSSAENVACVDGNQSEFRNENLPPRVFLINSTPRGNSSRYTGDAPGFSKDTENQNESLVNFMTPQTSNRTPENSFVKKLFVSCSPTKQKLRADGEGDNRENVAPLAKKKVGKRLAPNKELDTQNENVITFHYRLGIPRSPNIQNFSQFADKNGESSKEDCDNEQWSGENGEEKGNQKVLMGIKYTSKDLELLQKHGSLMKEFNKNVDLQKNLKFKSEKASCRNTYSGVDNKGFQNIEDCPRPTYPKYQEFKGNKSSHLEMDPSEECTSGNAKNENESDVYFGDISNSSCYVSVQNEGVGSSLYEEAVEHRNGSSAYPGESLLNKQNLKRIDDENAELEFLEQKSNLSYSKVQGDVDTYQQNYRSRNVSRNQYRFNLEQKTEGKKDDPRPGPSQDGFSKAQRRPFVVPCSSLENKNKYFNSGACYQDHYRPEHYQEASNSNDEHSSSSLTVDSGISTGRNYVPRCYDATYHEIECMPKENAEGRGDPCFETLNERFSTMEKYQPCKISNLENLSDFSHPLFQKPKIVPRSSRYKDADVRAKKPKSESEAEMDKKMRSFGNKLKTPEVDGDFNHSEDGYQKSEEVMRKSPKPLPRTSVSGVLHGKYGQKEKHFLAPDAQYEYKDSLKTDFKQKTQPKKVNSESKPVVPARPVNLQERCRNSNCAMQDAYSRSEARRRQQQKQQQQQQQQQLLHQDDKEGEDKGKGDIGNHSVNV